MSFENDVAQRATVITLLEIAIAYIVLGAIGWVAMGRFDGFILGGGAGMVVVWAALWFARRRKRKINPEEPT